MKATTVEGSMVGGERFDDVEKDKKKKRRSNRRSKQNPPSSGISPCVGHTEYLVCPTHVHSDQRCFCLIRVSVSIIQNNKFSQIITGFDVSCRDVVLC